MAEALQLPDGVSPYFCSVTRQNCAAGAIVLALRKDITDVERSCLANVGEAASNGMVMTAETCSWSGFAEVLLEGDTDDFEE